MWRAGVLAGFDVAECKQIFLHSGRKKCHSLHATVITRNRYVQINTGIPEKITTETLDHIIFIRAPRLCGVRVHFINDSAASRSSLYAWCSDYDYKCLHKLTYKHYNDKHVSTACDWHGMLFVLYFME